jgi:dTDP-glucose pyrophosphorylase
MEIGITSQPTVYEQQLIRIIRRLPDDRISQVVDFAKFLEFEIRDVSNNLINQNETEEEIAQENNQWDTLLARDDAQRLLEKMADEALSEINAGHAKPMIFNQNGQIEPDEFADAIKILETLLWITSVNSKKSG